MTTRILQWSDNHNDVIPTQASIAAYNDSTDLDMFIHTGDMVHSVFEAPINATTPLNTCFVVGNHDAVLAAGDTANGVIWNVAASQQQKFIKFFENNGMKNEMNFGNYPYATWWHHDFPNDSVTMLALDYTVQNKAVDAQNAWLEEQIDRCVEENRNVIIASHQYPVGPIVVDTNYNNTRYTNKRVPIDSSGYTKYYPALQQTYYIICKACDRKGLNVLLWMVGHTHADVSMVSQTSKPFPIIAVTSTLLYENNIYMYGNVTRKENSKYAECVAMNLYDYDSYRNTLQIYRLGANRTPGGKIRNMLIWDYNQDRYLDNSFSRFPE